VIWDLEIWIFDKSLHYEHCVVDNDDDLGGGKWKSTKTKSIYFR
jgi:hypothetical protein